MPNVEGRITFPGNPWPDGHAVTEFVFSARYVPDSGIWIDLHLRTENYYANDTSDDANADEEDEGEVDDWTSTVLWHNYHSCTLSSTFWAEEAEGGDQGVLAGTEQEPLDLDGVLELTCDENPGDPNDWPRPFPVYLLGHDASADHRIRITKATDAPTFDIEWTGLLALIYGGADSFEYEFRANINGVAFEGIQLPKKGKKNELISGAQRCLRDPDRFVLKTRNGAKWLVPVKP